VAARTALCAFERALATRNNELAAAIRQRLDSYQAPTADRGSSRIP
jgi:hypothetical protein